jgi:hypothetical protein
MNVKNIFITSKRDLIFEMIENFEFFDIPCYLENGISYQMVQTKGNGAAFNCAYGNLNIQGHKNDRNDPRFHANTSPTHIMCQACLVNSRDTRYGA